MKTVYTSFYKTTLLLALTFCSVQLACAQICLDTTMHNGTATFYTVSGMGNCSYPVPASPIYTAAINAAQYDTSATCGACIQVTSTKGTVILSIEDQCPDCAVNNLDISEDADTLLSQNDIIANVQWKFVGCPVTGPVQINITNSTAYYASVQIRNHRYAVATVEYKFDSVYVNMPRQSYNYFTASSGMGPGPFTFRITDVLGDVIEETGIPLVNDSVMNAQDQFPVCTTVSGTGNLNGQPALLTLKANPSADGSFAITNTSTAPVPYIITDILGRQVEAGKFASLQQSTIQLQGQGTYLLKYGSTGTGVFKLVVY